MDVPRPNGRVGPFPARRSARPLRYAPGLLAPGRGKPHPYAGPSRHLTRQTRKPYLVAKQKRPLLFTHETHRRVRYSETDKMGYLYYGNYSAYYEVARAEMLRSQGLTYAQMEEEWAVMMPVMSLRMRYVRPAHYDDMLLMRTTLRRLPERTITFHTDIYNEAGKLVNGGEVKLCFVDWNTKETVAVPPRLLAKLLPYFED